MLSGNRLSRGSADQQLVALSHLAVPEPCTSSPATSRNFRVATEPEYRKVLHEGGFSTLVAMDYASFCETQDKDLPVRTSPHSVPRTACLIYGYLFSSLFLVH